MLNQAKPFAAADRAHGGRSGRVGAIVACGDAGASGEGIGVAVKSNCDSPAVIETETRNG